MLLECTKGLACPLLERIPVLYWNVDSTCLWLYFGGVWLRAKGEGARGPDVLRTEKTNRHQKDTEKNRLIAA